MASMPSGWQSTTPPRTARSAGRCIHPNSGRSPGPNHSGVAVLRGASGCSSNAAPCPVAITRSSAVTWSSSGCLGRRRSTRPAPWRPRHEQPGPPDLSVPGDRILSLAGVPVDPCPARRPTPRTRRRPHRPGVRRVSRAAGHRRPAWTGPRGPTCSDRGSRAGDRVTVACPSPHAPRPGWSQGSPDRSSGRSRARYSRAYPRVVDTTLQPLSPASSETSPVVSNQLGTACTRAPW